MRGPILSALLAGAVLGSHVSAQATSTTAVSERAPEGQQTAPLRLTLEDALARARADNPGLEAMRLRLDETDARTSVAFTNYLPRVSVMGTYVVGNNPQGILLPRGSLGYFPELGGTFPRTDRNIPQGGQDIFFSLTTVTQPITHFFKIREGVGVARADQRAASAELRRTEQEVALGVLQLYAGVLLAQRGRDAARERVAATELRVGYQAVAVSNGMAAEVAEREARVRWLEARQNLLEREGEFDDLSYQLADLLGLPAGTPLDLVAPEVEAVDLDAVNRLVERALVNNPEVVEARALIEKATHGVGAARADYLPMVGVVGGHLYQSSVPFFPRNLLAVGITGSWTVFDWGARRRTVAERRAQLGQAEHNREIVERRVRGEVEAAVRKLERAASLLALAEEAQAVRTEAARLRTVQANVGFAVDAQEYEANAERMEADLDLLRAQLGYMIALAELERATGALGAESGSTR